MVGTNNIGEFKVADGEAAMRATVHDETILDVGKRWGTP
jgi:hypothetical protein